MIIIQAILVTLGLILIGYTRVMFSKHNAVFYYKGRKKGSHPIIEEWKNNIHILANQAYRTLFGAMVCLTSAILLPKFGFLAILYSIGLMFITSAMASYDWQKWINLGVGLPEIDPNEKRSYELIIFKKSYIIPKFWWGVRRKWISIISWVLLVGSIIFLFGLYNV